MKKIYLTAAGMALSIFGVAIRSNRTDVAWMTAALGFALVILLDYWRSERERQRRQAERRLLEKMVAALREQVPQVSVEDRPQRRTNASARSRYA